MEKPKMTYGLCDTCVFYKEEHSERMPGRGRQGVCRAHAPILVQTRTIGEVVSKWPETCEYRGCGDHQPAPPETLFNRR